MDETTRQEGELAEEFRKLGSNLKEALQSAWNSPDRQRLEQEIKTGLHQAAEALAELAEEAAESEAAKKLRSELEALGERVKSGDLENKIRQDVLAALRSLNAELERALQRGGEESSQAGRAD
jgi:hypothetical protein